MLVWYFFRHIFGRAGSQTCIYWICDCLGFSFWMIRLLIPSMKISTEFSTAANKNHSETVIFSDVAYINVKNGFSSYVGLFLTWGAFKKKISSPGRTGNCRPTRSPRPTGKSLHNAHGCHPDSHQQVVHSELLALSFLGLLSGLAEAFPSGLMTKHTRISCVESVENFSYTLDALTSYEVICTSCPAEAITIELVYTQSLKLPPLSMGVEHL